jgi:tetratricopeptide (TPR) repeat protein
MVLATPVASAQGSAFAELEAEEGKRLEACLDKIATDPENAYEDALGWLYEGRRPAARQCAALALIAMGQLGEGAVRLEAIARAPDGGSLEDRAHYLNLAGQTWLKAEQAEAALRTFDSAASLDRSLDVRAGRAAALVSLERWAEAEGVLDSLIKDTPTAATHRQRALARLNRGNLEGAQTDVDAALNLDPRDVDSLVVRGRLREAQRLKATTN